MKAQFFEKQLIVCLKIATFAKPENVNAKPTARLRIQRN